MNGGCRFYSVKLVKTQQNELATNICGLVNLSLNKIV